MRWYRRHERSWHTRTHTDHCTDQSCTDRTVSPEWARLAQQAPNGLGKFGLQFKAAKKIRITPPTVAISQQRPAGQTSTSPRFGSGAKTREWSSSGTSRLPTSCKKGGKCATCLGLPVARQENLAELAAAQRAQQFEVIDRGPIRHRRRQAVAGRRGCLACPVFGFFDATFHE